MSFTNLYYKRTAGTPKPCYVCYKPTTTVLATINTTDFLYTCPGHLIDPGFASPVGQNDDGGTKKTDLSPEEIAKVKDEWEQRQKKKKEKETDKAKEETKEKDGQKDKEEKEKEKDTTSTPPGSWSSTPSTPSTPPTHQRFTLHRDMFSLRQAEHRRRRQAAAVKDLAPRLPGAPRGPLSESF